MSARHDAFEDRLLLDRFRGLLAEMDGVVAGELDGGTIDRIEGVVLGRGADLLRAALQAKAQAAVEAAEKKTRRPARTAKLRSATRARASAP